MYALTILQPYAALIALPDGDSRAKRCENRKWSTSFRGPLAIHAGLSRRCIVNPDGVACEEDYGLPVAEMAFGAIVAIAELVECVRVSRFHGDPLNRPSIHMGHRQRFPWLMAHPHLEGPFAWVLQDIRPLPEPVPCRGMQGLWTPPSDVVEAVERQFSLAEAP